MYFGTFKLCTYNLELLYILMNLMIYYNKIVLLISSNNLVISCLKCIWIFQISFGLHLLYISFFFPFLYRLSKVYVLHLFWVSIGEFFDIKNVIFNFYSFLRKLIDYFLSSFRGYMQTPIASEFSNFTGQFRRKYRVCIYPLTTIPPCFPYY